MPRSLKALLHPSPKFVLPAVVIIGAIVVFAMLMANEPQLEPEDRETFYTSVRVREVQPGPVTLTVRSQGTVQPRTESELIPEVSGRVVWVSPALASGGYFQEGEALLRIDQADYRTALEKAEAALVRARAEHATAKAEYERTRRLHEQQLASESQLEQTERNFRVAEAQLSDARAGLAQAERDLARTEVTAPFSGRVRSERVDVGQFIARGESIATIYATDYVEVRLPIANRQLAYLNLPVGYRGQLDTAHKPDVIITGEYAGDIYRWPGKIVRTEAEIDTESRMFYAVARMPNEPRDGAPLLVVGLFVHAEIIGREAEGVVALPREALRDNSQVMVVDEDQRLHFRDVDVLRIQQDDVLIDRGLAAGEQVVVSPLQVVVEGMRVEPIVENADAPAALAGREEEAAPAQSESDAAKDEDPQAKASLKEALQLEPPQLSTGAGSGRIAP